MILHGKKSFQLRVNDKWIKEGQFNYKQQKLPLGYKLQQMYCHVHIASKITLLHDEPLMLNILGLQSRVWFILYDGVLCHWWIIAFYDGKW